MTIIEIIVKSNRADVEVGQVGQVGYRGRVGRTKGSNRSDEQVEVEQVGYRGQIGRNYRNGLHSINKGTMGVNEFLCSQFIFNLSFFFVFSRHFKYLFPHNFSDTNFSIRASASLEV